MGFGHNRLVMSILLMLLLECVCVGVGFEKNIGLGAAVNVCVSGEVVSWSWC